jgi:hypothetical protein
MELTKEKENGHMEKNTSAKKSGITKSKLALMQLLNTGVSKYQLIIKRAQKNHKRKKM